MKLLLYIGEIMIPAVLFIVVVGGILAGVQVYEEFVKGAKKGAATVVRIMPTLVGLMVAVGVMRASGFFDFLSKLLGHFTDKIGFPSQLVPLALVRMFSSSAATGILTDLFKEYGTDSRIGLIASIMMCCTETIFYTMSVYFMAAKIKRTRYTLAGALLATFAGICSSVFLAGLI